MHASVTLNVADTPAPVPPALLTLIARVPAVCSTLDFNTATSWVAPTKVDGTVTPLTVTSALAAKPDPLIASTRLSNPVVLVAGEKELSAKAPDTTKLTCAEVPPPGLGLLTAIGYVPVVARSAAASEAVSCEALTKVAARAVPPKVTVDTWTKRLPFTVAVWAALPAAAWVRDTLLMDGVGFEPEPDDGVVESPLAPPQLQRTKPVTAMR